VASIYFSSRKKSCCTKDFCLGMKNRQHLHKAKLQTQKKYQGAAISVEDAVSI
jgi:hypothetical protein